MLSLEINYLNILSIKVDNFIPNICNTLRNFGIRKLECKATTTLFNQDLKLLKCKIYFLSSILAHNMYSIIL